MRLGAGLAIAAMAIGPALGACGSSTVGGTASGVGGSSSDGGAGGLGAAGGSDGGMLGFGGQMPQMGCLPACQSDEFCDFFSDTCGDPSMGHCSSMTSCSGEGPVCTCASTIAASDCDAYAQGLDLSAEGACPEVADTFRCGPFYCGHLSELCIHETGLTIDWRCMELPTECMPDVQGQLSCDCVANIGCTCLVLPDGNLALTCNNP
ncbi:MAG: hypothetical protein KC731_03305 [Myxococcales bacterium]|nr:hypothetical protein [Myxococcales bacterium]